MADPQWWAMPPTASRSESPGKYLCEMLSTTLPGRKPTDTRHFISFDKQSGKYTAWWFNDTSTHPSELDRRSSGNKLVLLSDPSGTGSGAARHL